MSVRINIVGQTFGKLLVLADLGFRNGSRRSACRCECGQETIAFNGNLRKGHTKSCGCLKLETKNVTHGRSQNSRAYNAWRGMKQRCLNPNYIQYQDYGGRGIRICEQWIKSFESFFADMGECPDGLSIERKDNNGHYEPGNCVWATNAVQGRNRRNNVWVEFNGKSQIVADWSKELGIRANTLKQRLDSGWLVSKALASIPSRGIA